MKRPLLFALILSSATGVGCAAQPEDTTQADSELVNAPLDHVNTWSVGVCSSEPNSDPAKGAIGACLGRGTRCSGALVAPNLVMTARHCVQKPDYSQATDFCTGTKFGAPLGDGKVRVTLDASVLGGNVAWRNVAEVIVGANDNACKDDIAFLRLAEEIPSTEATPIALDLRPLAKTHPKKVAVVGRGILTSLVDLSTGAPVDGDAEGGLKRRVKTDIPWTCVSNNPKRPCTIVDATSPPTNSFTLPIDAYFAYGPGLASGDSGAAILSSSKFKKGKKVAIGVHSASTFGMDGVGNHGVAVRLDQHAAWIKSTLAAAAAAGKASVVTEETPAEEANAGEDL